jgi:hypothetical protein
VVLLIVNLIPWCQFGKEENSKLFFLKVHMTQMANTSNFYDALMIFFFSFLWETIEYQLTSHIMHA